ncbi:hypothetical protein EJB05_29522, partial [Eragrostis curvula]
MADEMTEHAQAASTEKSTASHAAAGARPPSTSPLPEPHQFPDRHDSTPVLDEAQNHGVPPPPDGNARDGCNAQQIHGMTFQAMIEADPSDFFPPGNDDSAEHALAAATADSRMAEHDAAVVVPHGQDLFVSSEQEAVPEHEAVRPIDEEQGRHNGMARRSRRVTHLGALIHRVADLDGYDDRESRELVAHALESGLLPGFRRRLHEHSNEITTTTQDSSAAAALVPEQQHQVPDDEHDDDDDTPGQDEGADDDDLQVPEEGAPGIMVTARDQFELALMVTQVTQHLRLRRLDDMFRNGGFDALFPSDRDGVGFDELPSYRNGGFGAVPASAAAVAGLEKRTFHAGEDDDLGGCAICLDEEFEEGQELSVMPCSHAFHTQCINAWLGQSNMCPLCRHALPRCADEE